MAFETDFLANGPQLTEWRVSCFKSLLDATIALAPLTIITGANSSGKSSLLQSMLALTQTFCDADERGDQLVLNGQLVRLGSAYDVVTATSTSKSIRIGFTLDCAHMIPNTETGCPEPISLVDYIDGFDVSLGIELEASNEVRPAIESCVFTGRLRGAATSYDDFYKIVKSLPPDCGDDPDGLEEICELTAWDVMDAIGVNDFSIGWTYIRKDLQTFGNASVFALTEASSAKLTRKQIFMLGQLQPQEWPSAWHEWGSRSIPVSYTCHSNASSLFLSTSHLLPAEVTVVCDGRISMAERWIMTALTQRQSLPDANCFRIQCPRDVARLLNAHLEKSSVSGRVFRARKGVSLRDAVTVLQPVAKSANLYKLFVDNYEMIMRSLVEAMPECPPEPVSDPLPLSEGVVKTTSEVLNFFRRHVHYIGPLRVEPAPTYPNTYLMARYVGRKGEETASILTSRQDQATEYPEPETNDLKEATLLEATVEWLRYLGVCHDIQIRDLGRPGFEVLLKTSEKGPLHDLTHAGVGVSQVLPLVVQGLVALPGDHLLIEQPELHLHPAVQARLGDFFLALTQKDVRCIIESHSEHMIDRVRYRIASSDSDDVRKKLALYFVEKPEDVSVVRKIDVDQYGALLDWPAGFFDQSTLEAEHILRAGITKRKREMN